MDMYAPSASSHEQIESRKQPRKDEFLSSSTSLEPPPKRIRTVWNTIGDARVDFWRENGNWPTVEQENTPDRFRCVENEFARKISKSSLLRKRTDTSIYTETTRTQTLSDQQPRKQKNAPYRHPRYEGQLQERGSFMTNHDDGITIQGQRAFGNASNNG
ncbi:hypothetical protein CJF31_00009205 [Rutstroemia sp. NJR-2017a BVV2]|nr:hypothetical protein CJF31_00009205 [Rutstroemia sp. NJR-2017a BVV2]